MCYVPLAADLAHGLLYQSWRLKSAKIVHSGNAMSISTKVFLRYESFDFSRILDYLKLHSFDLGGRYKLGTMMNKDGSRDNDSLTVRILTHAPMTAYLQAESTAMFALCFELSQQAVTRVIPAPNFDLATGWTELALLELGALGRIVHGKPA